MQPNQTSSQATPSNLAEEITESDQRGYSVKRHTTQTPGRTVTQLRLTPTSRNTFLKATLDPKAKPLIVPTYLLECEPVPPEGDP